MRLPALIAFAALIGLGCQAHAQSPVEGEPKAKTAPAARPAAPPASAKPVSARAPAPVVPAGPATPVDGEWTVGDGSARMRLGSCGKDTTICGFTAWTKDPSPGLDHRNPDPAKRTQPIVGTQILIDMKPAKPNRWEGTIYNPKDGKIYQASITLRTGDEIRVEGCLLGFLCGGDTWKRASPEETAQPTQARATAPRPALPARTPAGGRPKAGPEGQPAEVVEPE